PALCVYRAPRLVHRRPSRVYLGVRSLALSVQQRAGRTATAAQPEVALQPFLAELDSQLKLRLASNVVLGVVVVLLNGGSPGGQPGVPPQGHERDEGDDEEDGKGQPDRPGAGSHDNSQAAFGLVFGRLPRSVRGQGWSRGRRSQYVSLS